ncbi:major facilitator superfamily domain-containing protein [Cladorrhinum samala]|uniref:Major facilitator superfamily domain-containing protein n=1 Tax=Cladorrhinum samala TaxID=585594 RepID=A0AAV9HRK6_9PEZI|nr:major facilitator superfamily domain-containing protein [Cladorrhinum samala]
MTVNPDRHHRNDENPSPASSVTAAENTPLLRSDTSSITARDVSPSPTRSPGDDDSGQPPLGWKRGTCIILGMWVLIFLQASNMSGISTTQSTIASDLDAYAYAMWFTSSYLIAMSSTAPLIGRLSMIFSPGLMILTSSLFFSLGAIVTSIAPSFAVFIFGRVLCGIGSGGVMTLCMILVIQLTSKRRRGLWIGLVNAGFTFGVSFGAVVFGALLPVIGWRLLFASQSPLALLAGISLYLSLPARSPSQFPPSSSSSSSGSLSKIDYPGAVTLALTITLLLYSLSNTFSLFPLLLSLITFLSFLSLESSHPSPILPLSLLSSRPILLSCLAQLGFMASRWTVLFYSPIFVLAVRGLSPAVAGSVLIPTNLGFGLGGLLAGALHIRRAGSFYFPSVLSLVLFTLALLSVGFCSTAASPWQTYVAVVFFNGLFTGAAINYSLAHLLHVSVPEMHFIVTGLLATFRGFAGSFGTAVGGGVFARTLTRSLRAGFDRLDMDPGRGGGGGGFPAVGREKLITILTGSPAKVWEAGFLTDAERVVAVASYEKALQVLYKSAAAVCVVVLIMQMGTGWTAPVGKQEEEQEEEEEEERTREAVREADPSMEA